MKYKINTGQPIPQGKRAAINEKILYLITNGIVEKNGLTPEDIFNCYTGEGGLHGLDFKEFENFHEYTEAKKLAEIGQFFTPHNTCRLLVDCIRPSNKDIIYDLTCGMGNFFNYLPVEANVYGADVDIKAVKVAKYLYPSANIAHEDLRTYEPPMKADIVFGNPPFNLDWNLAGEKTKSQMFFCMKAADVLKPAGLLAMIVPGSFLADEFTNGGEIEKINSVFNFVAQFDLPANTFAAMGVSSFQTKIMLFQRKSRHLPERSLRMDKEVAGNDSEHIFTTFIAPLKTERDRLAGKLYFEGKGEADLDSEFMSKITKYLFDIRQNKKLNSQYGKCESYLQTFLTQERPEKMSYEEWEKTRIKDKDVLAYLKKVLSSADRVYRNERRTVKTTYGFYTKDYSEKESHGGLDLINDCVLDGIEVDGFESLLRRKRSAYELHLKEFDAMKSDPKIAKFLRRWSVYSQANQESIKLTKVQAADTNKLLQKRYGVLQYGMGSGKTLCGLAMAQYTLKHTNAKNVFVVAPAIAINNTWDEVLKDYSIDFLRIFTLSDLQKIKPKQIVILTLDLAIKLQRHLKKLVKCRSQKVMLIFDESDAASNPYSKRTKAMLSIFRKCRYKYLTTGTMTRNNVCEAAPQLELLYNNSINYLSECKEIYEVDKEGDVTTFCNGGYRRPIPAYRAGYELFAESHLPRKITVFGVEQKTQDIFNSSQLKRLLDRTVITKSFEQVVGRKIYEIQQITVPFNLAERRVYKKAIEEFEQLRRLYYTRHENSRKDSLMKVIQQLLLLLKVCADPSSVDGYFSDDAPTKIQKTLALLDEWDSDRVAIGVRHIEVLRSYERYIRARFPDRPVFVIIGGTTTFKQRRAIVRELEKTPNGILISTQQALSSSQNIDFVDKILLPELHYNNAAMSQYYFRFIRYTSQRWKQVFFLTYEHTIESNLLRMILAKEKLNLFMKNENLDEDELYERFGVDPAIVSQLMSKEYDEKGRVRIRWGEQEIV